MLTLLCTLGACGGATSMDDLMSVADAAVDKAASCASTFGAALTEGYGRVDGTIVAVVPPGDNDCAEQNSDHLVLQLSFGGATYRMVVNVMSDDASTDTNVRMAGIDAPLVGPAFAAGTSSSGDSAHLVHRNLATLDGAIVVNPTTAPRWLLFAFADQTF